MLEKLKSLDVKYIKYHAKYIVISLLVAILLFNVVEILSPKDPRTQTVIISKETIAIGEEISLDNAQEFKVTPDIKPKEVITLKDLSQEKLMATVPIEKGMILTPSLASANISSMLTEGKVAQIVTLKEGESSEFFPSGSKVNLLGQEGGQTKYLARQALVLPKISIMENKNTSGVSRILVAVTQKESENLSSYEKTITPIIIPN